MCKNVSDSEMYQTDKIYRWLVKIYYTDYNDGKHKLILAHFDIIIFTFFFKILMLFIQYK